MLDSPQPGQYRPNTRVNVIAGAVLGALIGGVIVFVMEYLASNILKSREELEHLIAIPVLAVIPEGKGE
jgi:capsular polysaccharide biosynthesis protein